jgi:drug/metabolite transporter (DMT)-like permease
VHRIHHVLDRCLELALPGGSPRRSKSAGIIRVTGRSAGVFSTAALDPSRIARRDLVILVLGVANNALYLGLNYVGMCGVSAGLSALIVSANPVLTTLLASFVLGEQLTWRKAAGLSLGIGGVAMIVESRLTGGENPVGAAFVISALVALVGGTILFKRLAPSGGLWIGNCVQSLAGGLVLAPFASTW